MDERYRPTVNPYFVYDPATDKVIYIGDLDRCEYIVKHNPTYKVLPNN